MDSATHPGEESQFAQLWSLRSVGPDLTRPDNETYGNLHWTTDVRDRVRMRDRDKELWVDLYRMAMMELENAKIAGRTGDARSEITARLEKLHDIPGLHIVEKQAIDDALSGLCSLERTEEQDADTERRVAERALQSLRVIAPDLRISIRNLSISALPPLSQ
jgi:hypothetical protein